MNLYNVLAETEIAAGNTDIPAAVTNAFKWMISGAVTMVGIVTGDAVLSLGIAMWAAGGAIGLFKRLV